MQQTAGIHIRNIPSDSFDKVSEEIKRFFDELEDKPLYFDEWRKGLYLYKERGEIRVLSDVPADYYDYDIILYDLILHLAENVPGVPMNGTYDLANDDEGPEFHDFKITAQGEVVMGEDKGEEKFDAEDVDDILFLETAGKLYGVATAQDFYNRLFGALTPSDIKKACDMFATICGEGAPESVYEEMGIESDSPNMEDLIKLVTEYRDYIWSNFDRTTMCSYVSFLIEVFTSVGVDIKFPEELKTALSKAL